MAERIARVHIALEGIEPAIWRRVEVPLGLNLKGLHDVIQAAMGWQNHHLFEFRIGENVYGQPDPTWDTGRKILQAKSAKLEALAAQGVETFDYVYDTGDNWRHAITIEAVEAANPAKDYPRFIDGARRCPPENVGGILGYGEFLEADSNPRHREHRRLLEWYGGRYDPNDIDEPSLRSRLDAIAKRRASTSATRQRQVRH